MGFYHSEKDENQRNRSIHDGMWAVTVQKSDISAITGTMSENSEIQSAGLQKAIHPKWAGTNWDTAVPGAELRSTKSDGRMRENGDTPDRAPLQLPDFSLQNPGPTVGVGGSKGERWRRAVHRGIV